MMTNFANPNAYPVDGRGVAYSMAFFSAKHLGAGQYYLMTIRDKDRKPLEGSGTYRLNVPANAPVKLYWSATVYDRATHALIREPAVFKPRVDTRRAAEERRRFGGRLFRPQGAGGQGDELGADRARTEGSRCCSVSTARRSRSSTRRGCCRTSSGSQRNEEGGHDDESLNVHWPSPLLAAPRWWRIAQAPSGDAVPVTVDNFIRAEIRRLFANA